MSLLYAHAQKIVDEDKKYAGLFLGTGSTKTRIALCLAKGKTLIICPKTQALDRNWQREVQKIQKEDPKFKIDLDVISKENFKKARQLNLTKKYDTVIVDEAHTCLGATPTIRYVNKQPIPKCSKIYDELALFIMEIKPERLYLLTATIIRTPMTVWAAARLLGQDWNFYEFRDAFYVKLPIPGREVWSPRRDSATKDRLASAVRKLGYTGQLSDYFDVPEQNYKTIYLELTDGQRRRLNTIRYDFPDPLVLTGKKHQIENGVLSGDEFNAPETFDNTKIDTILDLALEFPKMVIFARYTAQIEAIRMALKGYKVFVLTGQTKDRETLIREANETLEGIVIVQAQISSGWELPSYPVMVFASLDYSVVNRIQAEGRILRANALKKNLYIDLVIKGGTDEAVFKAIQNKEDFIERIYNEQL